MTQEQAVLNYRVHSCRNVPASRNSQFFTNVLESGTVLLYLLQIYQAFLSLRTKC